MAPKRKAAAATSSSSSSSSSSKTSGRTTTTTTTAAAATAPPSSPVSSAGASFSWKHVILLFLFNILTMTGVLYLHYSLPTPLSIADGSAADGVTPAQFSEVAALDIIRKLSEDIGYRIVGTREHVEAEEYLQDIVKSYEGWHHTVTQDENAGGNITRAADPRGDTQVEVWTQIGDGAHRFDFISSVVWKKYYSMSNVIVRISDGTDEGKEHAVLLNAHLDSTLPSPGAADDGVGIAILVELLRLFTTPPRPRLRHSVILLFNNGEESFQDASHLYATQHNETIGSVRGVVNLEACGVSGPELLFQATSVPFVDAYAQVPHPFGTVLANDVFSTGLILSDTDFRQFVQYGGLSGLDMAVVGNSYLYHTRKDLIEYFQPGMIQHFGENVVAIINYLTTSPQSKLAVNRAFPKKQPPIYFSVAGRFFFNISPKAFQTISYAICALLNFFLSTMVRADSRFGSLRAVMLALLFTVASLVSALVASNVVALIMTQLLGKSLSWFTHEMLPLGLFAPPAFTAVLTVQLLFSLSTEKSKRAYLERACLDGLSIFFTLSLLGLNAAGIGSAYLSALGAAASLFSVIINDLALVGYPAIDAGEVPQHKRVHPVTYFLLSLVPASIGIEGLASFLDLFVPLTGRTGEISPADHIVSSIVAALSFLCLPLMLPLAHRMGTQRLKSAILAGLGLSVLSIALYASPALPTFDAAHPKRLFVHYVQNITDDSFWMNMGGADPDVSGLTQIVEDVHAHIGISAQPPSHPHMDAYNTDYDILYPVSTFITPNKFAMTQPAASSPWTYGHAEQADFMVRATEDEVDLETATRRVTLTINRPGIIWSVIAFDADILEWDLPSPPPQGMQRHHIKEVSRHGTDQWSVKLLLRLSPEDIQAAAEEAGSSSGRLVRSSNGVADVERKTSKLWIDYSGLIAEAMYPQAARYDAATKARLPSIKVLEEMDEVITRTHPEVDAMLLSVVAAVAQV